MGKKKGGKKRKKTDYERIGLFMEPAYMKPCPYKEFKFNISTHKGQGVIGHFPGQKDGTNRGYFTRFARIYDGTDAITQVYKDWRRDRWLRNREVNPWLLTKPSSKLSPGLGMLYGTFSGPVEALSPVVRPPPEPTDEEIRAKSAPAKKFLVKSNPKGSGYGFPNVTITRYPGPVRMITRQLKPPRKPPEVESLYPFQSIFHPRYFDENPWVFDVEEPPKKTTEEPIKKLALPPPLVPFLVPKGKLMGGCKEGCFTPNKAYGPVKIKWREVHLPKKDWPRRFKGRPAPLPTGPMRYPFPKSAGAFVSVLSHNVETRMNSTNYKTVRGTTYLTKS